MEQQLLFPNEFPEFDYEEVQLTDEVKSDLAKIADAAKDYPLIVGERKVKQYGRNETRRSMMNYYIDGQIRSIHYLIKHGDKTVGYLGIWDGWLPLEMEQYSPDAEMCFLHPDYMHENKQVKDRIYSLEREVAGNHGCIL